jgi:hypothetical protein
MGYYNDDGNYVDTFYEDRQAEEQQAYDDLVIGMLLLDDYDDDY